VVIQTVSFAGTMKMIGIKADAITSGQFKTMGSPLKDMSPAEREVFRKIVSEFYGQFVSAVGAGRPKLSADQVKKLADGRIYTGRQALEAGLVDALVNVDEALDLAKTAAGIKRAKVVMYHRAHGYRANTYSAAAAVQPATQINLVNLQLGELGMLRRPQFLYLWSTDLATER